MADFRDDHQGHQLTVTIYISVRGQAELEALAHRLKMAGEEGKGLKRELRQAIQKAAKPAVAATKEAILTLPVRNSSGGGSAQRFTHGVSRSRNAEKAAERLRRRGTGLRRTIADAIGLRTRLGNAASVRISVNLAKLPPGQRSLPRLLNRERGWRHPFFGHDPWTTQHGRPWFASTLKKYATPMRVEIFAAMKDIAERITHH